MTPTVFRTARLLPLTAAAGLALLLAATACDGRTTGSTATGPIVSTPGAPTPTPTSTDRTTRSPAPVPPTGPDRCHTADVTAGLHHLDAAAGSRYTTVVLTNRTSSTCRVYGYGGVQLLDAARHPLPTHQVRDRSKPPHPVLLGPGASASSVLRWSAVSDDTESSTGPCQPTPAYLLVTPPDETQPITVSWSSSEAACSHGRIGQSAYVAGTSPTA